MRNCRSGVGAYKTEEPQKEPIQQAGVTRTAKKIIAGYRTELRDSSGCAEGDERTVAAGMRGSGRGQGVDFRVQPAGGKLAEERGVRMYVDFSCRPLCSISSRRLAVQRTEVTSTSCVY